MNLTIDIGNTNVILCFFNKKKIHASLKLKASEINQTNILEFIKTFGKDKKLIKVLISSVVPNLTKFFKNIFDSNKINYFLARDLFKFFKLKVKIKNKKSIGDDRLVNVIYAKHLYSKSVMIIDFGTATTIDVLDKNGNYDGGVITPGIDLSLKSLREGTAKLPLVKFKKTKKVLGKSTLSAIQSGFFWGYYLMIKELVSKIEEEQKNKFGLIITGGNSKYFRYSFDNLLKADEFFNSKGLNFIINSYLKTS